MPARVHVPVIVHLGYPEWLLQLQGVQSMRTQCANCGVVATGLFWDPKLAPAPSFEQRVQTAGWFTQGIVSGRCCNLNQNYKFVVEVFAYL